MNKTDDAAVWPHGNHVCRWRAVSVSLLTMTLLVGLFSVAQAVGNKDLPTLPSIEVRTDWQAHNLTKPELEKTITPRLDFNLAGTEILMTFKIGEYGRPYEIHYDAALNEYRKRQLGKAMKVSLSHWKFSPVTDQLGNTVVVKVALPVRVVSRAERKSDGFACLDLRTPVLLAVLDD